MESITTVDTDITVINEWNKKGSGFLNGKIAIEMIKGIIQSKKPYIKAFFMDFIYIINNTLNFSY